MGDLFRDAHFSLYLEFTDAASLGEDQSCYRAEQESILCQAGRFCYCFQSHTLSQWSSIALPTLFTDFDAQ